MGLCIGIHVKVAYAYYDAGPLRIEPSHSELDPSPRRGERAFLESNAKPYANMGLIVLAMLVARWRGWR